MLFDSPGQEESAALNSRRAFVRQVTVYLDEHFMEPLTLEEPGEEHTAGSENPRTCS